MTGWGWHNRRSFDIWRIGPTYLRIFATVVPWITVAFALIMMHFLSGTLTLSEGTLFDLIGGGLKDGENTDLVALVTPVAHDTLVFFDDARYSLRDEASCVALGAHLAERANRTELKTLLVMMDRRVEVGDAAVLSATARKSGIERILFANKADKDELR